MALVHLQLRAPSLGPSIAYPAMGEHDESPRPPFAAAHGAPLLGVSGLDREVLASQGRQCEWPMGVWEREARPSLDAPGFDFTARDSWKPPCTLLLSEITCPRVERVRCPGASAALSG